MTYVYEGITNSDSEYRDYEFTDGNPRHLYTLTYNVMCPEDNLPRWSATLMTSETDDGEFDGEREPQDDCIVNALRSLIPERDLPTRRYQVSFDATVDMVVEASSPEAAEENIRERFIRSRSVDELQNTPLPRGGFILGIKAPAEGYDVEEY